MAKNKKKTTTVVAAAPVVPAVVQPKIEAVAVTRVTSPAPNMPAATETLAPKTEVSISQADIARRAYEVYRRRAGAPGTPFEDWCQAERELRELTKPVNV